MATGERARNLRSEISEQLLTVFKERFMQKALELVRGLRRDEEGAALIEYTVLLGIMLVAVIVSIIFVGGWLGGKWTALTAALP